MVPVLEFMEALKKATSGIITIEINNDGSWILYHMAILQLENCIDSEVGSFLRYEFVFLFNHSQGHSKKFIALHATAKC